MKFLLQATFWSTFQTNLAGVERHLQPLPFCKSSSLHFLVIVTPYPRMSQRIEHAFGRVVQLSRSRLPI